jgi:xylulokinase
MREMNIKLKTVRLSGGGAKSKFWRQLQADIYGSAVATTNSDQGPAYGVALLAGVGTGVWKNVPQACDAVIREVEVLRPQPHAHRQYPPIHKQYQQLYPALKDQFASIAKL